MADDTEKFKPKNWKSKTPGQLKKLSPQEKARYLAYEEAPKEVVEYINSTQKRVKDLKKENKRVVIPMSEREQIEQDKHSKLIGQLKAAEARNRIRMMRLQYQSLRAHELKQLIACQPTSLNALRLEALVPPYSDNINPSDELDKVHRARIESILEDTQGLTTNRKLD